MLGVRGRNMKDRDALQVICLAMSYESITTWRSLSNQLSKGQLPPQATVRGNITDKPQDVIDRSFFRERIVLLSLFLLEHYLRRGVGSRLLGVQGRPCLETSGLQHERDVR